MELNSEQKRKIGDYFEDFLLYVESREFEKDKEVALDRISFYKEELPRRVKKLSEVDII